MQLQEEINDLAYSPSFSHYFSDSLTAAAAAKVSREFKQEQADQFHEFSELDEADFEFSMEYFYDDEVSGKQFTLEDQKSVFPVFDGELLTKEKVDLAVDLETKDANSSGTNHLQKLIVDDRDESASSSSSSESDDFVVRPSGIFCMWRSKAADVESSPLTKCKKSSSTGSGSRMWRIRNLLRRSNSEGKDSIFFLSTKRIKASDQKRNIKSGEVTKVAGNLKTTASSPSFQELFYVQKRAEQKSDKMKSFLPYRQDLLGFFVNINRTGNKKLSF